MPPSGRPRKTHFLVATQLSDWLEPLLAAIVAAGFFVSLYGELPYHDVSRFATQVNSGRFVWDIAHIYLQPATLLWHRYLGFGETAEESQKHISTFATAVGIGVFYALLQRLHRSRWERCFASILVMVSGSIITLAPSSHMKLVAFPFVNAALLVLIGWERATTGPDKGNPGRIAIGAGLLAIAASFLVSALATAPFATLAVLIARRRAGAAWRKALGSAILFASVCGATFLALAGLGYALFVGLAPSVHGMLGSVTDKVELESPSYGLAANLLRLVFGTANNLILSPHLGSIIRAWVAGEIPSLAPYVKTLLEEGLSWAATLALVAAIYLRTALKGIAMTGCLAPAAFLLGAQAWTAYYGLNDPEHWFQLTVPTVVLFLMLFPPKWVRAGLPVWAVLTASINVLLFALPYARYPLRQAQAQISSMFGPDDLLVSFGAYPGGPDLDFIRPSNVPVLFLDRQLRAAPDTNTFFADVDRQLRQALDRHGRVVVFGSVLDPYDWNAPWPDLLAHGVRKERILTFFYSRYQVKPLGMIAGLQSWEILGPNPPNPPNP